MVVYILELLLLINEIYLGYNNCSTSSYLRMITTCPCMYVNPFVQCVFVLEVMRA